MRRALPWLCVVLWPTASFAVPPEGICLSATSTAAPMCEPLDREGQSFGYAWRGRLREGVLIEESTRLYWVEHYRPHRRFFGTREMADLVVRVAATVSERFPGLRLPLGEVSAPEGGLILGHRSHQSGRDVDLGFYLRDAEGAALELPAFVSVRRNGEGAFEERPVFFHDEANWALIEALLTDPEVPVQHIFVSNGLRQRLLDHAASAGVSRDLQHRALYVLRQPGGGARPHTDHFHVRIYCSPQDRERCYDRGPYWDWTPRSHTPYWNLTVGPWQ
ncbi:MAG: penicillin-insensitive murein endopeptidase [Myxococcota bacterium]